jgi:chemotaxis protein CheD
VTTRAAPRRAPELAESVRTITVRMGQMAVARDTELLHSVGLGSCVAIVVFAPAVRVAAMAHCMLPTRGAHEPAVAKFADSAVPALLQLLRKEHAHAPFAAALIGGASMFPTLGSSFLGDIAGGTIRAARTALAGASIPIRVEDVGGSAGRSVLVDPASQRVMVRTIRDGERWL